MKGSRILLIQVTLEAMVLVMQFILLLGGVGITYGLFIPVLLIIMILFGAQNSLSFNHTKTLSKMITDIAPKEKSK